MTTAKITPAAAFDQLEEQARSLLAELGERMAHARSGAGFTQASLADALRVSIRSVSRWENGASDPSLIDLRAFAQLTGRPLRWLRTGAGRMA